MPAWGSVGRERLPAGWSWPVDREQVDDALRAAGVRVGTLTFAVPEPAALGEPMLLDVRWLAADPAVIERRAPFERLLLRVWAVPDGDLTLVTGLLDGGGLARACSWAAAAVVRESPTASRCLLTTSGGALHVLAG